MEFQVPQFITRESTITVGLTFRQFIILVITGAIVLILFFLFKKNIFIFILITAPIIAFVIMLAFGTMQGIPFTTAFKNLISYLLKPRLYTWKKGGMNNSSKIVTHQPQLATKEKVKVAVTKKGQLEKLRKRIS